MADVTFIGSTINESATVTFKAKAELKGNQGLALALNEGKLELPAAGANVLGLSLFTNDDAKAGDSLTVQVKDIGKWIAGGAVAAGDELAVDAAGKAVKAAEGQFIVGIALSAAAAAGTVISVQLTKSGYKPSAS
nr:MAG TPA: capsid fiber protein [Caudoviricetes sp.]